MRSPSPPSSAPQRWLVTGGSGLLGSALCAALRDAGREVVVTRRTHQPPPGVDQLATDLDRPFDAGDLLDRARATHVVHAAALADVDACERRRRTAWRLHAAVSGELAAAAAARQRRFVLISTDQLWERRGAAPAGEDCVPEPLNVYGWTKAVGEVAALRADPDALVVRTNFFGLSTPWRRSSSDDILNTLRRHGRYAGFSDVWYTPIALPLLCRHLLAAVDAGATGPLHLAGGERISKYDFGRRLARHHGLPPDCVTPRPIREATLAAPRPEDMSLDCSRAERLLGTPMPTVRESIEAVYGPPHPAVVGAAALHESQVDSR